MKLSHLKKVRLIVSIIFFVLLSALFLDFGNVLSPAFTNYLTYLQFLPSLIKFIHIAGISAAGFLFVLIFTLLFGSVYCSSFCPLGTLQDIISFIAKKIHKKKYFKLLKVSNCLRYSVLASAIIFFLSGSLVEINLLDPYSNFGRIITQLFKPILISVNNLLSSFLIKFNIYSIFPAEIKNINLGLFLFPFFFFFFIFTLSYKKGRLFCNTLCPVGTLLGIISRVSFFKIEIDKENCISCNSCERVCKAGCIDKKNQIVDFSKCVSCYNCFTVCLTEGIKYTNIFSKLKNKELTYVDFKKREFLTSIITYAISSTGLVFAQKKIIPSKFSNVPNLKKIPVSPPGSISIKHFTESCTACNLCVSACPNQVLQPSFLEYGLHGILQPKMDYKIGYCNFECIICGEVCPTGAIQPMQLEKKKITQLGKAKFIKENCIVYTEKTDCGACSEHCPTKAVTMIPYENIRAPKVKEEYCIGCGACEYACPTKPYKAIFVEGNSVHQIAKKIEEKKIEQKVKSNEDFPF